MAKAVLVDDTDLEVEGSALGGFVEGDLDLPEVELYPQADVILEVKSVAVQLAKSSGLPSLKITAWLNPDDYIFGFDRNNAPDGITGILYVSKISFGTNMELLASKKTGQQGVSTVRKLFGKLGVPFTSLRYGPRDDLGGAIFLDDSSLKRLEGAKFKSRVTVEENSLTGELENKFVGINPLV